MQWSYACDSVTRKVGQLKFSPFLSTLNWWCAGSSKEFSQTVFLKGFTLALECYYMNHSANQISIHVGSSDTGTK